MTVTTTVVVDEVIKHQFLSADLESVNKLRDESKKVLICFKSKVINE